MLNKRIKTYSFSEFKKEYTNKDYSLAEMMLENIKNNK